MDLLPFQKQAVTQMLHFLDKSGAVYNGCEMRLGKTVQCCAVLKKLELAKAVLIICPTTIKGVWKQELAKWTAYSEEYVKILDTGKEIKDLDSWYSYPVVIVSYNLAAKYAQILAEHVWGMLIIDESHHLVNPDTLRVKSILGTIWQSATKKILLSGTPFQKSIVDGYPIFSKLLPTYFNDFDEFAARYAYSYETDYGTKYYGVKNAAELSKILRANFFVRYTREEVDSQLPKKTWTEVPLPSTYSLETQHIHMQDELKAEAEKLGKLHESQEFSPHLASYLREQNLLTLPFIVEYAKEILSQGEPLVIFAWHREFIETLQAELKIYKPVVITGDTTSANRQAAIEQFQSGITNCFIGQMKAAGEGFSLSLASNVLLAELYYSPSIVNQAIARLENIEKHSPIQIHYFVVEKSIQKRIVKILVDKTRAFKAVLDA